jgi:hypothetical protein
MTREGLRDYVQGQAVYLLGDRVSSVQTGLRDHGFFIGIGITAHDGRRHAVGGESVIAEENPERWTGEMCARLVTWLDATEAARP